MNNSNEKELEVNKLDCPCELLAEVAKIETLSNEDAEMNIFDIENLLTQEVPMCRFLKATFDREINCKANEFIEAFLKEVGITEPIAINWRVEREHVIDGNRRIDIALINNVENIFIPIEAKIYAKDKLNQCRDYIDYARGISGVNDVKLIYLTVGGAIPSKSSCPDETYLKYIHCIKWEALSKLFKDILKNNEQAFSGCIQVAHSINQFCVAIDKLTKVVEDSMDMNNILLGSEGSFKNAAKIAESMNDARTELMRRFFMELGVQLGEKIKEYDFLKEIKLCNPKLDDSISEYYQKGTRNPGIAYRVDENKLPLDMRDALETNNMIFAINIEIGDSLYVGFCLPTNKEVDGYCRSEEQNIKIDEKKQEWYVIQSNKKELPKSGKACQKSDWWMQRAYIKHDGKELNFKNDNCLAQLCNSANLEKWVVKCVEVFEHYCTCARGFIESNVL